ncbi:MAG: hypothetical protein HC830_02880 [Bacteroidetes bacterium]|nr:hypothetical protein [Bacteroidota bacterium]
MKHSVEHHVLYALLCLIRARLLSMERRYANIESVSLVVNYLKRVISEEIASNPLCETSFLNTTGIKPRIWKWKNRSH